MKKKKAKKEPTGCELVMCEDPTTGKITVKPKGKCPPGYLEKIMNKAAKEGIGFKLPGPNDE